jgi:hypothetical protein
MRALKQGQAIFQFLGSEISDLNDEDPHYNS